MRLRQLFEDTEKHVSFCFGRMNPPTIGHAEVFKTLAGIGGDYFIFLSQSQDKKENPLSFEEKVNFVKAIHPQYAGHIIEDRNLNTVVKVASYLYDQGYRHATFVAGSDRLDQFKNLLTQYNGVEGKAHGYYNFELLDFKSSGDRDPDSPGVSGVSASKARAAAANNDFKGFQEATGAGEIAKEMFDAVRQGMGIKESVDEGMKQNIAAAALAAANLLGTPAQAADEPIKPITVAYVMIDGEMRKYNLGDKFDNAREAEKFITSILDKQGLQGYQLEIKHGYPKKDKKESISELKTKDSRPEDNFTIDDIKSLEKETDIETIKARAKEMVNRASKKRMKPEKILWFMGAIDRMTNRMALIKLMYDLYLAGEGHKVIGSRYSMNPNSYRQKFGDDINEAPIEMDPNDPMDPMIVGHDKANPAKLKYRMLRAAGQIKDLASRVDKASPSEWQTMTRQFEELKMNMEQIRHALDELAKLRKKGGIRSRGIDPFIS